MIAIILCLCTGYLIGSLPTALVVCKLLHASDPRSSGSGNPGTTNVLRLHGKKAALLTLLGDITKGTLPVLIAMILGLSPLWIAATGLTAMLGHIWPVFAHFKGGKGFATFIGVLLGLSWPLTTLALLIWLVVATITGYSSLAALSTAALTPFLFLIGGHIGYLLPMLLMAGVLGYRHTSNIQRLINRTEPKINLKKLS